MLIGDIGNSSNFLQNLEQQKSKISSNNGNFGDTLKGLISDTNSMQNESGLSNDSQMSIGSIEGNSNFLPFIEQQNSRISTNGNNESFGGTLKEFISDTNSMQREAGLLSEKMIKGEPVDLHEVMISAEKAKTSFQLLMEIRNKFLDMYREISRLQV